MTRPSFGIRGTGRAVPDTVITNDELEKLVDTSDAWITKRTGIKERRRVDEGKGVSDLAIEASRKALDDAGMDPTELDLIVMATVTPDHPLPATSCKVQAALGATKAAAFDISAACTGFMYATNVAAQFLWSGTYKNVLVIGGETLTRITNYEDRSSCILFGDGAGAVIYSTDFSCGEVRSTKMEADGTGFDVMIQRAGGGLLPCTPELIADNQHKLVIHGREVYKFAVSRMVELVRDQIERNPDLELGAIVPHQVNMRIIEAARERLDLPSERIYVNIERYGNTSAGSIPVALDEARRTGFLDQHKGKLVVMCAFGAGLTWGSVGMRW